MFKCDECGKETALLWFFYHEHATRFRDHSERCKECFDKAFKERYDKNDEE